MVKEGFYIIVAVCIIAVIAAVVGFASPKITTAADAIAEIQFAPQRAAAKIQNENALADAHAEVIRATARISETQAIATADIARTNAQVNLVNAQTQLEEVKSQSKSDLARIEADQRTAGQFWNGMVTLGISLAVIAGLYIGNLIIGNILEHRNERARIDAHTVLLGKAIDQMQLTGGQVILDNARTFTIFKPEAPALPALTMPALPTGESAPQAQAKKSEEICPTPAPKPLSILREES